MGSRQASQRIAVVGHWRHRLKLGVRAVDMVGKRSARGPSRPPHQKMNLVLVSKRQRDLHVSAFQPVGTFISQNSIQFNTDLRNS
jgi:hypothetical protein